jgi:hypothetical protein
VVGVPVWFFVAAVLLSILCATGGTAYPDDRRLPDRLPDSPARAIARPSP